MGKPKLEKRTVTAASIDEANHPIYNMINFAPTAEAKPAAPKKAQANFKIDPELLEDFKLLCKLQQSDLSKKVVAFIQDEVDKNQSLIEKHKKNNI